MLQISGPLAYRLLCCFSPRAEDELTSGARVATEAEFASDYGPDFLQAIQGKTVIDFGSGAGAQAVAMVQAGAARVIGLEIQEKSLALARHRAQTAGVQDSCVFMRSTDEKVDVIVSKDAFEHFEHPDQILQIMAGLLRPGGAVRVAFGPTWYHPRGGHFFSVFPWSHLLFSEQALLRWRANFRSDSAQRFADVAGGLNQMTIRGFEALVAASPFEVAWLETVPIKSLGFLRWPIFREMGSSLVRCQLVLKRPNE